MGPIVGNSRYQTIIDDLKIVFDGQISIQQLIDGDDESQNPCSKFMLFIGQYRKNLFKLGFMSWIILDQNVNFILNN